MNGESRSREVEKNEGEPLANGFLLSSEWRTGGVVTPRLLDLSSRYDSRTWRLRSVV
jgi:hypothetical protein